MWEIQKFSSIGNKLLTSICSMMVAPSLETITSPSGDTSILSIPLGPREVFKRFATVLAAIILAYLNYFL